MGSSRSRRSRGGEVNAARPKPAPPAPSTTPRSSTPPPMSLNAKASSRSRNPLSRRTTAVATCASRTRRGRTTRRAAAGRGASGALQRGQQAAGHRSHDVAECRDDQCRAAVDDEHEQAAERCGDHATEHADGGEPGIGRDQLGRFVQRDRQQRVPGDPVDAGHHQQGERDGEQGQPLEQPHGPHGSHDAQDGRADQRHPGRRRPTVEQPTQQRTDHRERRDREQQVQHDVAAGLGGGHREEQCPRERHGHEGVAEGGRHVCDGEVAEAQAAGGEQALDPLARCRGGTSAGGDRRTLRGGAAIGAVGWARASHQPGR